MGKELFTLRRISKSEAEIILTPYHYLSSISAGFKSGFNYGLFLDNQLVGVCIFTGFPVPELSKGMFGLPRTEQTGFFELSRLCLVPFIQAEEHNIASWFLSRAIKSLRIDTHVRCILSYADSQYHTGIVYRACNFGYYGLSASKKDYWVQQANGSYLKHTRGKIKGLAGEWRDRSRKHRYVLLFDKTLSLSWSKQ